MVVESEISPGPPLEREPGLIAVRATFSARLCPPPDRSLCGWGATLADQPCDLCKAQDEENEMQSAISFGAWLALQTNRRDPVGDLARDFVADDGCGRCDDIAEEAPFMGVEDVAASLTDHGATQDAFDAFNEACAEWTGR